jgi:hypothetical protein
MIQSFFPEWRRSVHSSAPLGEEESSLGRSFPAIVPSLRDEEGLKHILTPIGVRGG